METEQFSESSHVTEASAEILYPKETSLESICRICSVNSDYLMPVFSGEGLDQQLSTKISTYLPIKVAEDDDLPKKICYQCASTILAWHELVENCLKTEKRLNNLSRNQSKKGRIKRAELNNSYHMDVTTLENSYQNANTQEKTDNNLRKSETGQNEVETSVKNISKNKKRKHEISKCLICNKIFQHADYLKIHLLTHSDVRPHLCHICGASFKRKDHANQHKKTVHCNHPDVVRELKDKGEEPITCDLCGEVKPTRKALALHKKRHDTNLNCDICGAVFSLCSLLKSHMMKNHDTYSCVCETCGEVLKSGYAFYLHKRKHSTAFICYVCGKSFIHSSSLRTHMVVHSDERPWTCDLCNKSFKLKTRLKLHEATHSDCRPHDCLVCVGKSFKTKSALIVHNNMHRNVRPYPCPHCPFRARKNSDLLCHVRTHTGEKPYKCDVCGRGFAQSGDMRKHRRTHDKHI
uniref:Putative c2h2-type zn-finger protein n=1 Tax=Triatoma infestans TaxID=30076 RepID=A0A023EZ05_TRIIF